MSEEVIKQYIETLKSNQLAWEEYAKVSAISDFAPYGAPGITSALITKAFKLAIKLLSEHSVENNSYLTYVLVTNLPSWTQPIAGWIQSVASSPSIASNIFSHLQAIISQFSAYEMFSDQVTISPKKLSKLTAEQESLLKQITQLKAELEELSNKKSLFDEAINEAASLKAIKASAEADAIVAGAHRESIESSMAEADKYLKSISDLTLTFPNYEKQAEELISSSKATFDEATNRLLIASQMGLAGSFKKKAESYRWPKFGWLFLFVASLGGVVFIAFYFTLHNPIAPEILAKLQLILSSEDFSKLPQSTAEGTDSLIKSLKVLPLILPLVWLAWFSALKYSQLARLKEDYEFKVAAALALDGYRKEAKGLSPQLEEKLLELAITNFGENPLRLMTKDSAKDAHPLAGIIDEKGWGEVLKEGLQSISNKVGK